MIRRIRDLLYEQGFTISGARNQLQDLVHTQRLSKKTPLLSDAETIQAAAAALVEQAAMDLNTKPLAMTNAQDLVGMRAELVRIRDILNLDL